MPNKGETRRVNGDRGFSRNQENAVRGALRIFASGELNTQPIPIGEDSQQQEQTESEVESISSNEDDSPFDVLVNSILSGEVEVSGKQKISKDVLEVIKALNEAFPFDQVAHFNQLVPQTDIFADLEVTLVDSPLKKAYLVVLKDVSQTKQYLDNLGHQNLIELRKAGIIVLAADRNRSTIVQRFVEVLNKIESSQN